MLYNDEEARKEDKRFEELLQYARNLSKQDMELLTQHLNAIREAIKPLVANPYKTKSDLEFLAEIKKQMQFITEEMNIRKGILDESLFRQSLAYYQHIKKLAAEGNEVAIKIYEDLKPTYQDILRENLGEN